MSEPAPSPETARRARMCTGKHAYAFERAAARAVAEMVARGAAIPGWTLNHYRCEFCRHWHVGNTRRGDPGEGGRR